jgi:hypothetical protein
LVPVLGGEGSSRIRCRNSVAFFDEEAAAT